MVSWVQLNSQGLGWYVAMARATAARAPHSSSTCCGDSHGIHGESVGDEFAVERVVGWGVWGWLEALEEGGADVCSGAGAKVGVVVGVPVVEGWRACGCA